MKSLVLLLISLPLFAFQDCTIMIRLDPVKGKVTANDITYGSDDDIASGDTLMLDLAGDIVADSTVGLNLSLSIVMKGVWKCRFHRRVRKRDIVVNYSLVANNGLGSRISNGTSSIPVSVTTDRLRLRNRRKTVQGDVKFTFDLSDPQVKNAGRYGGTLTIEVYAN